ncbi:MAG: hypothetical protein ABFS56_33530 [Pseudomonadota bacterium]
MVTMFPANDVMLGLHSVDFAKLIGVECWLYSPDVELISAIKSSMRVYPAPMLEMTVSLSLKYSTTD